MQIQLSGIELVLSLLAFLGVVAFIIAIYVSYKFLKLYRKTLRQSQMTFQKIEEKIF